MYPNEVVRIGGRSQDPAITKCNLNELKKAKMSETLFKEIQRLRSEVDRLKHDVDKAFKALSLADQFDSDCFLNNITVQQVVQLLINCNWSETQVKSFKKEIKRNEIEFTEVRKKGNINSITKDEVEVIISELDRIELNTEDKTMAAMYNWPDDLMTLIDASIAQWIPDQNIFAKVNQQFSLNVSAKRSSFLDKFNSRKSANEKRKSTVDDNTDDERDPDDEEQERLTAAQGLQGGPPKEQLLKEIVFTKDSNHSANHPRLLSCVSSLMSQSPIEILINAENLWELSHEDRVAVIQSMILQQFEEAGRNFEEALRNFEDVCSQKIELENQHKIAIMTEKKVVGMIITGASIHNEFLGQLRPAIMIVEEAAEVQESQLIAALGDWTEYLIMIGDHKQLRPKVESHVLARDFHMDVSMMERLIANKFPYATLRLQNRMRPEFAKLLSDIYPDLKSNLERVESNAPANYIYYSSFFWDHTDLEPNLKSRKFGRIKQEIKPRSFINEGEADRAIMLALFLIQQGYEPRQITILAAYQGQSVLLRKKCRQAEKGYPQLFDRYKLHDDSKASSDLENKIRIHTIDMYQGDENDFVIISLVRSNPAGIIGFLDSFNRRCVAQSRSRCGLYFIGNASTLSFRRSWRTLIQTLHEQNRLDSSIPLNCPNHREETIIRVRSSNDLKIGQKFCKLQCIFQMSCGKHQCRRLCQPPHHHDDECRETVTFTHPKCRHKGEKECHEDESKMNCHKMVPVKFSPCGHQKDVKCYEKDQVSCKERCTRKLEDCGHMCQQECGEVCRPEDCSFCAKLREEEAMKRRKADEESIKVAKREVEKQLEELKKNRGSSPSKFERKEIHPNGDTASEYYDTYDRVMKYIQPGHSWFPVIKKIEKVTNNDLELKWLRAKKQLFDPRRNELKFHGTSLEGVEGIIKDGFRMPKPGNQMYGAGIYFASDSSKSAQEIYTKGSGMLLLCDVLLGKSLTVNSAEHNMDLEELKQRKYDSLYAKRGTRSTHGVLYDEFVVFNPDQAIPRYIIHYAKEKLKTIEQVDDLQKKAIASGETKKYVIRPNREVNLRDPLEVHYRIAESQFLRLIHHSGRKKTITSVDYYINPRRISKFRKKKEELKKKYGKGKESKYILAFHGTKPDNVDQIMSQNFRLDKIKRTAHGFGIYFSEFPDISIGYGSGLILCKILPGRSYRGDTMPSGYDSNIVAPHEHHQGRADMVIIGNPDQILPCYVIHFSS